MTTITIPGNFLDGMEIRKARKSGVCEYGRRVTGGPRCRNEIKAGDYYVAGECDPYNAGGYGQLRYCAECCAHLGVKID